MPYIHPFNAEVDTWAINKVEKFNFLRWLTDQLSVIQSQCIERGTFNLRVDNAPVTNTVPYGATLAYTGILPVGSFTRDNTELRVHVFGSASGTTEKEVFIFHYGPNPLTTDTGASLTTGTGEALQVSYTMGQLRFSTPDIWRLEVFIERYNTNTVTILAYATYDGQVQTQLSTVTLDFDNDFIASAVFIRDNSGAVNTITKLHGSATYRRAS